MPQESLPPIGTTSDTLEIGTTLTTTPKEKLRELILFVGSAAKTDSWSIGFLPYPVYEQAHAQARLITLRRNNDLCGFILFSLNSYKECRILQIWVRADARIIEHGRAMINWLEQEVAIPANCWCLRCWVAVDLPSNLFWNALAFTNPSWRWGPAVNPRRHRLWIRRIHYHTLATPAPICQPPPLALALSTPQAPTLPGT